MTDEFQFWRDSLAGKKPPISADHPQSGYYRKRNGKGWAWLPVAIWTHKETGRQVARVADDMVAPLDVWTWVAGNPVAKEAAVQAFKTGAWPGDAPSVASQEIGANNPPSEITDLIPLEVAAADEFLAKVGRITTQVDSDIASNKVDNLRKLRKAADLAHKTEKEPHLAAGRAVDDKYRVREDADNAVRLLLAAITVFHNAEKARLQKIADEKAAKERAEWEKQKALHEAAAAKSEFESEAAAILADAQPPPKPPEPVKVKSGGAQGKAVSLRTYKVATITDYDKALVALKDHPELRELVQKLADRACKAGVPLDGVKYSEEQRAA
jgi:hypothetical protein